jgi:hypothetical protein
MPPSLKIIKAVARAICENAQEDFDQHPAEWMDIASVAIAAFLAAMKEDEYVMVPVEPTEAMRKTALWHGDDYDAERYATMRAARIDREG